MNPPLHILLASAAWKGCCSPSQANRALGQLIEELIPTARILTCPLSDGGDGWLDCLSTLWSDLPLQRLTCPAMGAVPSVKIEAPYLWNPATQTAYVEAAQIHGFGQLPEGGKLAPLQATSYGVGQLLQALPLKHPTLRTIMIALGGSTSTDGGLGALQALGWSFYDSQGVEVTDLIGAQHLPSIVRMAPPWAPPLGVTWHILTDVTHHYAQAPACFGPQKGVLSEHIPTLTTAFERISAQLPHPELALQPGTGAAGGLALGLLLHAQRLCSTTPSIGSGSAWYETQAQLEQRVAQSDWVITGEGCFDKSSLVGKATGKLLSLTQAHAKPLLMLCGQTPFTKPLPSWEGLVTLAPLHDGLSIPHQIRSGWSLPEQDKIRQILRAATPTTEPTTPEPPGDN